MSFGEILKEIRTENGDTLRQLADKAGVIFTYIHKVETGASPISKNLYEKLIKVYPLYRQKLTKAYLEEVLPESIKKEMNLKVDESFLSDMKNLIYALDKENQKIVFLCIIEKLEYIALKNGTYDEVKVMLEKTKEKIK